LSDTALRTENVTKIFGKGDTAFAALKDISFEVKLGESVAIVGKSGSGKSTLMHVLALLDNPSEGSVYVGQQNASAMTSKQVDELRNKSYGFVFQQFFLNENDTVLNNITLPLKIGRIGHKERNKQGLKVLDSVELSDKANVKAGLLSGGQKQRACIARALINSPKVIFADEPTGNLDSQTGKLVEDLLFDLNSKQGITLIIVTHDEDFAVRCSRQIHLKDGLIVARGKI
jgi:putative ABC transport system ATP-binding protein